MKYRSIAALCVALAATATALAQPCDDWTGTMRPPVVYPGIFGQDILAHGDLMLVADDSLLVYDLGDPGQSIIGRCALPATANPAPRLREVEGTAYVAFGNGGVLRLDLTVPTNPTWQPAFVPGTNVKDLAAFSGGVVVVAAAGDIYVLDSLGPDGQVVGQVIGQAGYDDDLTVVVANGTTACVGGRGFAVVDLAEPTAPIVSSRTVPFGGGMYRGISSIAMAADRAVAVGYEFDPDQGTDENSLYTFALDDPPGSPPAAIQPVALGVNDLELIGDHLVSATSRLLLVYSWPELVIEVMAAHPRTFASSPRVAATDANLLLLDTGGPYQSIGLMRYPLGITAMVPAIATLPPGYIPAGCGRFGWSVHAQVDFEGTGWTTYEVNDQQDPCEPTAIHTLECYNGDDFSCRYESVAPHDRWAVVKWTQVDQSQGDPWLRSMSVFVIDAQGNRFPCMDGVMGNCAVVGDTLWTIARRQNDETQVEAFDLSGDLPVSLGTQAVTAPWGQPYLFDNLMLIVIDSYMFAYDVTDPASIIYRGEVVALTQIDRLLPLGADNLVLATTSEGLAVFEVVPQADPSVVARAYLTLGGHQGATAIRGDLVATGDRLGWRLVSIADPDAPIVVSETMTATVDGFIWSEDFLYVGVPAGIYLYDVADPTTPVFVGQVAGVSSFGPPCAKDYYLMKGSGVYPRDCADPLSSEGGQSEHDPPVALPGAVVLHAVAPNPFNPRMTVTFDLAEAERVAITIHDLRGRRVATLVEAEGVAGRQAVTWAGVDERGEPLPSGTYLVRLATASAVRTVKAVLVR